MIAKDVQIREDDVNEEDESAQHVGHERGEESREEEDNRENGLHCISFGMLHQIAGGRTMTSW